MESYFFSIFSPIRVCILIIVNSGDLTKEITATIQAGYTQTPTLVSGTPTFTVDMDDAALAANDTVTVKGIYVRDQYGEIIKNPTVDSAPSVTDSTSGSSTCAVTKDTATGEITCVLTLKGTPANDATYKFDPVTGLMTVTVTLNGDHTGVASVNIA